MQEFVSELLCVVDHIVHRANAGYFQIPKVISNLTARCQQALLRNPATFEALIGLVFSGMHEDAHVSYVTYTNG